MKKLYAFSFLFVLAIAAYSQNLVQDSSLEAGTPSSAWTESSLNFGTPICDSVSCGTCNGPCRPNSGQWYAWFGGIGALEIASLKQTITIPTAANATWQFYLKIPTVARTGKDTLAARIDGTALATWTDADSVARKTYSVVQINANAYANNASHVIELYSACHDSVGYLTNFLVDDISLRLVAIGGVHEYFMSAGINVFPNPTSSYLNVQFVKPEEHHGDVIELYDSMGNKLNSKIYNAGQSNLTIDLRNLVNGIYFIKITGADGTVHSTQVVVNH